jgi:hypothetical protein
VTGRRQGCSPLAALAVIVASALGGGRAAAGTAPDSSAPAGASTAPASPAALCSSPECHQFDFWIGDWEVRTPKGSVAGTNRVVAILGGCAIQENWKGARGMSGTSLNMYVPSTHMWHQTWVDDHGTLLLLDGRFEKGAMVLTGEIPVPGSPGQKTTQRITWTQLEGGKVRQLWETSTDGGKTWTVAFDGTYSRKS